MHCKRSAKDAALVSEKDEDVKAILASESKKTTEAESVEPPKKEVVKEVVEPKPIKVEPVKMDQAKAEPQASVSSSGDRIFASPLAKKLASEQGIDLSKVKGTGNNGRIIKADIDNYIPYSGGSSYKASEGLTEVTYTDEPVSQMRDVIARRLAESKFTAPHFYLNLEINMEHAISFRVQANSKEGVKISYNDMVVKAVALSLREHPAVNSAWMGDFIRRNEHVNIGVAIQSLHWVGSRG